MSDRPTPVKRARELRQKMTDAESLLWINLRNRKFHGLKFLRQHPIVYDMHNNKPLYFIADFYCAERKLIIEVDGKIHDFQKEEDQHREEILKSLKLTVLQIKNEEVGNVRAVLDKINKGFEK
jgi:leucyl-tRNA synthetase